LARAAVLKLRGNGDWERVLRELKPEDVRGIGERVAREEEMETFRRAQTRAGVDPKDIQNILQGKSSTLPMIFVDPGLEPIEKKNISWIWYTYGDQIGGPTEGADNKEVEASKAFFLYTSDFDRSLCY
jgi:hypothetical protein